MYKCMYWVTHALTIRNTSINVQLHVLGDPQSYQLGNATTIPWHHQRIEIKQSSLEVDDYQGR